jgi:preprotein translocase subunit SecD
MRARLLTAAVAGSVLIGLFAVPGAATGRSHQFRMVAVLANLPPLASVTRVPTATSGLRQAVTSCDVAQLTAAIASGAAIPTSGGPPVDTECSVLPLRDSEARLLVAPVAPNPAVGAPAGLSGRDVRAATAMFSPGIGNAVALTLTATGATKLNALAASLFGRPSPRGEVAFVVDGLVYAAPAFQTSSFTGPIQITGNFTARQARSLVASITAARRHG